MPLDDEVVKPLLEVRIGQSVLHRSEQVIQRSDYIWRMQARLNQDSL